MYRLILGKVSALSAGELPSALIERAPQGARRASWLAVCCFPPLPDIIYGEQGNPAFAPNIPLWFNLSHSGDDIALLVSDEGEVGCDIEVIRTRANWRTLANELFCPGEQAKIETELPNQQLAAFWRVWTCKEAIWKRMANRQYRQRSVFNPVSQPLSDQ